MRTISHFKKTILLGCLTLALPLALQAEPMMRGQHEGHDEKVSAGQACEQHHVGSRHARFMPGMHHELGIPPYLRDIDLTEAQRDKLFSLMYAQMPAMREQGKLRHKTMAELRALSSAETFDDGKAQQLTSQLANIEKDMLLARTRNDAKIFAILTPEQRQKLEEARKAKEERGTDERVNFKSKKMGSHQPAPRLTNS
ncbi:MAG: Spy/CpxP family protein refolding chaperone [Methylophilaceae bacterium]